MEVIEPIGLGMAPTLFYTLLIFTLSSSCNTTTAPTTIESVEKEKVENRGTNKENWWGKLPRAAWKEFNRIPCLSGNKTD